ncbi:hypothetical protein SAMN04489729_2662 [Amycolatopsis lurida]|nr:hypothetical protein SAMN04489729_2662 [Amycolatopsis lurida]
MPYGQHAFTRTALGVSRTVVKPHLQPLHPTRSTGQEPHDYPYAQGGPTNRADPTGVNSAGECVNSAAGLLSGGISFLGGGNPIFVAVGAGGYVSAANSLQNDCNITLNQVPKNGSRR